LISLQLFGFLPAAAETFWHLNNEELNPVRVSTD